MSHTILNLFKLIFIGLIIALILNSIKANENETVEESHSTSVAGMAKLVLLEARLIKELRSYKDEVERRLKILKTAVLQLRAESAKATSKTQDYITNPLNAFSLIRRMHMDWIDWKVFMEEPIGWSQLDYIAQHKSELPSKTDLEEACEAFHRLSEVYNLTIGDMAKGYLNGKQYDTSLNALDTYAIGQFLHKQKNQYLARQWFVETKNWLMSDQIQPSRLGAEPEKMLKTIAEFFLKNKYYSIALPIWEHALVIGNKTNYIPDLIFMANIEEMSKKEPKRESPPSQTILSHSLGCRGKFVQHSNLYCEYKFKTSPFLLLAPLKMEIVLENPRIVVFHNVLSDGEIIELQNYARPLLKRTLVQKNGTVIAIKLQTSKGAWLKADRNSLAQRIVRRAQYMTDLNLQGAEQLQVMNYGLAGHYDPHFDYFNTTEIRESESGDQIATLLFYLSDVEQGGATVFPKLELAVSPEPGTALFWYNLHDNGTGDLRTLHAGCPVLVGSKWVMTHWIGEREQLFTRPCRKRLTN